MKKGVIIVNTARGKLIDEQALVDALETGKVFSAGLDVYEEEPKVHQGLLDNPNVVLLPHVGTSTWETQVRFSPDLLKRSCSNDAIEEYGTFGLGKPGECGQKGGINYTGSRAGEQGQIVVEKELGIVNLIQLLKDSMVEMMRVQKYSPAARNQPPSLF
jgi:hypothetical protein